MKNSEIKYWYSGIITISLLVLFIIPFSSCEKGDKNNAISSEDSIYYVINELMNTWYLWYDEVPEIDIYQFNNPPDLMEALMYSAIDKWSFVEEKEVIDAIFQEGETFGFGFQIRFDPSNKLRILYVYENSEAYRQGLRKGFIVQSINGIPALLFEDYDEFFDENPATYTFEIIDANDVTHEITLSKSIIQENGVFYKNIYNVSGHSTGYLVYDSFLGYTEDELNEAFAYFKANNISELIVDLRYNQGGYISLAEQFANMVAPLTAIGHPMYTRVHNDIVGPTYDSTTNFSLEDINLNLDRIFFLTSQFSASASELTINVLEPYMDVFLIGSDTYGKPVGMYGWLFHDWYIYPVTVKLQNADGFGDFFDGLPVDVSASEGLDKDWGDETDPCLSQAFHYISFGSFDTKSIYDLKSASIENNKLGRSLNKSYLIMDR